MASVGQVQPPQVRQETRPGLFPLSGGLLPPPPPAVGVGAGSAQQGRLSRDLGQAT